MGYGDSNTFRGLRFVNVKRCEESFHKIADWTPAEWMTAVAGEVGEAANLIKKLRRIETDGLDSPQNREMLGWVRQHHPNGEPLGADDLKDAVTKEIKNRIGDEIADVVIYLDLLAERLGIDMGEAVIRKFNRTSEKVGSPEKLPY